MLNSFKNILFSTKLMAVLLFVFAFAIAYATFIENDYGTSASKALFFNAKWFELVQLLLAINLIGNIVKYKLYRWKKAAALAFHSSFIIIIIGAGITRYIGYEGSMHIREGEASNTIVSSDTFLQFKVDNEQFQYAFDKILHLNTRFNSKFSHNTNFEGNEINVTYNDYIQNAIDTVVKSENGEKYIEIVTVGQTGRISKYIKSGETVYFGKYPISFNDNSNPSAVILYETDSGVVVKSPFNIHYMSMDDQSQGYVKRNVIQEFKNRRLYTIEDVRLVFKELHSNSIIKQISSPAKNPNGPEVLIVDVTCNNQTQTVSLKGGRGYVANEAIFQLEDLNFSLSYGSKKYTTPFYLKLNDFIIDKYPGSMSPSSFESEVTLVDERKGGVEIDHKIFMNNVLDYDGYRFFQSSYDRDERGTVLSVNHDFWGTIVTYFGYFLMILGMIITLVVKKSRFAVIRNNIKKLRIKSEKLVGIIILTCFLASGNLFSQGHEHHNHKNESIKESIIDEDHADQFSRILIQDQGGRIKPIQTFASEIVRKISRKDKFNNLSPTQVFLGMMHNPSYWQSVPLIKVSNPELEAKFDIENHYSSFLNFFDDQFNYKILNDVKEANRKKPAEQSQYDKEIIKVDERINICYMVFQGSFLKVFPKENDHNNTWFTSFDYQQFNTEDSIFVKSFLELYFTSVDQSLSSSDWSYANNTLIYLADYQQKFGKDVIPAQTKIDAEIIYNRLNIFKKLFMYYALIGLLMLVFLFANIFYAKKWKKIVVQILIYCLFALFISHTAGLIVRWYISGHAPWSNGYEAMIFIAWVTVLAGFIFSKASKMTIAATAILSSLILMVAHLNFMDPEITPLVPVLKSYWLMIHVAVITGSYGFLGLGAVLGLMNLILMASKISINKERINHILQELTYIIELTLTVGLFMAAIGTFLGGVWANESWGRYWGWDPKETWALVIVLVYAIILHLRFIHKANSKFVFNLLAVLGFSTVIMTYFGVNYYLSGLHSYATGDPVPIPTFVPITVIVIIVIAIIAFIRNKKYA
jgi:cytochrome c-type biogenesis protein CcsB